MKWFKVKSTKLGHSIHCCILKKKCHLKQGPLGSLYSSRVWEIVISLELTLKGVALIFIKKESYLYPCTESNLWDDNTGFT